jgi:nicotinate-nucleotide adenylyltransferase
MHRSAPVRFGSIKAKPPAVGSGQRIGLLGGSFNPPHAAHVLISEIARRRLGLDAVWWLVTPGNPLKSHGELAPLSARLIACRDLVGHAHIKVTGFEANLATPFTAATLAYLQTRHPNVTFVWLMGADCLAHFHRWQQWRQIAALMPIAVIDRPGWHLKGLSAPAAAAMAHSRWPQSKAKQLTASHAPAWTFLTGPLMPLSSTSLRSAKKAQKSNTNPAIQRSSMPTPP